MEGIANDILVRNLRDKLNVLEQIHANTNAAQKPLERVRRQLREAQAARLSELLAYNSETATESQDT